MLIAFAGLKGSGKSTAAQFLVQHCKFHEVSFADPIRAFLRDQLGLDEDRLGAFKEIPCEELGGQTPRYVMQTLGTEWGRNMIWQDLWTERFRRYSLVYLRNGESVVAADVRFQNEIDTVQGLHGKVFWIMREDRSMAHDRHISENSIRASDCDGVIFNRGTKEAFWRDLENELFHTNLKTIVRAPIFRPAAAPPPTGDFAPEIPAPQAPEEEDEIPF